MPQVSQLCRALLLADPCERLAASGGQSVASCLVSRLEAADGKGQDAMETRASASDAGASRTGIQFEPPRAAAIGALARGHGRLGSVKNPKSGPCAASPPIKFHSAIDGMAPPPSPAGGPSNDSCRRDRMLLFRGAGRIKGERGGAEGATSSGAAIVGGPSSEEKHLLGEVDELVQ